MGELQRWTVTYTKHVHQKRKVYQDGILEHDGPKDKISLYDETEKLLDSRYLKKDETVSSGVTFLFNSYLVDVGDCEGKGKPLSDSGVNVSVKQLNEKKHIKRPNTLHNSSGIQSVAMHNRCGMLNHEIPVDAKKKEWDALYTTQLTQKSKKYHDGILQLTDCGSHTKQVILLSEERSILSSKYVKSVECLRTGASLELPSYLVQVSEPRDLRGDDGTSHMSKDISVAISNIRNIGAKKKHYKNKPPSIASRKSLLVKTEGSGCSQVEKIPGTREASRNRTIRNVSQILSGLQKAGESHGGPVISSAEQVQTSKLSFPLPLDAQNECKTSSLSISRVESPKMATELQFKVDDGSCNQSSATCISTSNIIKKTPDCQHKLRLGDSSPSSGLFTRSSSPMASNSPRKCSANSQPIKETFAIEAKLSEDGSLAIKTPSAGSTTSIKLNAVDWPSKEKEILYSFPSDTTDLETSCGTTLIFSHVEGAVFDQHAALSSIGGEEIGNTLPVDMSSSGPSSYSVPATATPEPSPESSSMSKAEKLRDIPSFDLGI